MPRTKSSNTPKSKRALPASFLIPLQPDLPDGDYTVRWKIVSTDGHIEIGDALQRVGERQNHLMSIR